MAKTAVDKVTGEGAKYVAAGKKAQEKAQVRSMAANWTGSNIPAHAETKPTPANLPSTGLEHLSSSQFKNNPVFPARVQTYSTRGSGYEQARGAVPASSQMHPGGFGSAKTTPATSSMSHPGGYGQVGGSRSTMGNRAPGAPGPRALSKSELNAKLAAAPSLSGSSAPTATAKPNVRGNANTSSTRALGKSKMRTAVKNKASKGKARAVSIFRIRPSKHAGANAENLRKATGA